MTHKCTRADASMRRYAAAASLALVGFALSACAPAGGSTTVWDKIEAMTTPGDSQAQSVGRSYLGDPESASQSILKISIDSTVGEARGWTSSVFLPDFNKFFGALEDDQYLALCYFQETPLLGAPLGEVVMAAEPQPGSSVFLSVR